MFTVYLYMYMYSLFSILMVRKHIFLCLISLEFIIISMLMIISYYLLLFCNEYYFMVMFMVMFVCEGVLGLSVLVSMIRCYGNDNLSSLSLW